MDGENLYTRQNYGVSGRVPKGRRRSWMALAMLAFTVAGTDAQTTYTWSGGGGAGNQQWSKNNNWAGVSAPSNGTTGSFVFSGSAREFAPENDRSNVSAASIVFATNSSTNTQSYNLTGSALSLLGGVTNLSTRWHTISLDLALSVPSVQFNAAAGNLTLAGAISGAGSLVKTGAATLVLSRSNNFRGAVSVSGGVLDLASSSGSAVGSASALSISKGAMLLLSRGNQVNDSAAVTLSGGAIHRASGVSEAFGDLRVTAASFLDFGSGAAGTLGFGNYTPGALLTVQNFFQGNVLTFRQNLSGSVNDPGLFAFDNKFTTEWDGSTFIITAIPEASALAAAVALLGIMLWPSRRLIARDFKRIVGLRAPMRDRLARLREQ